MPQFWRYIKNYGGSLLLTGIQMVSVVPVVQASPTTGTLFPSKFARQQHVWMAQVTPVKGRWKLRFSASGIVHESTLLMTGYSGWMRTQFFSPSSRRTNTVVQRMRVRPSARGLLIVGYNPVYEGTKIRHPTYLPDALLFQINPDGSGTFFTCDTTGKGQCSPIELEAF